MRFSHPRLHGVCVISCACVGVQRVGHSSFVCSRARAGLAPSRTWVTFGGAEIGHPVAGIASQHALVVCDARWVEQVAPERHAPATELANVGRGREPPTCGLLREGGSPAGFYQARRLAQAKLAAKCKINQKTLANLPRDPTFARNAQCPKCWRAERTWRRRGCPQPRVTPDILACRIVPRRSGCETPCRLGRVRPPAALEGAPPAPSAGGCLWAPWHRQTWATA